MQERWKKLYAERKRWSEMDTVKGDEKTQSPSYPIFHGTVVQCKT